jgi:hypothetical protein
VVVPGGMTRTGTPLLRPQHRHHHHHQDDEADDGHEPVRHEEAILRAYR